MAHVNHPLKRSRSDSEALYRSLEKTLARACASWQDIVMAELLELELPSTVVDPSVLLTPQTLELCVVTVLSVVSEERGGSEVTLVLLRLLETVYSCTSTSMDATNNNNNNNNNNNTIITMEESVMLNYLILHLAHNLYGTEEQLEETPHNSNTLFPYKGECLFVHLQQQSSASTANELMRTVLCTTRFWVGFAQTVSHGDSKEHSEVFSTALNHIASHINMPNAAGRDTYLNMMMTIAAAPEPAQLMLRIGAKTSSSTPTGAEMERTTFGQIFVFGMRQDLQRHLTPKASSSLNIWSKNDREATPSRFEDFAEDLLKTASTYLLDFTKKLLAVDRQRVLDFFSQVLHARRRRRSDGALSGASAALRINVLSVLLLLMDPVYLDELKFLPRFNPHYFSNTYALVRYSNKSGDKKGKKLASSSDASSQDPPNVVAHFFFLTLKAIEVVVSDFHTHKRGLDYGIRDAWERASKEAGSSGVASDLQRAVLVEQRQQFLIMRTFLSIPTIEIKCAEFCGLVCRWLLLCAGIRTADAETLPAHPSELWFVLPLPNIVPAILTTLSRTLQKHAERLSSHRHEDVTHFLAHFMANVDYLPFGGEDEEEENVDAAATEGRALERAHLETHATFPLVLHSMLLSSKSQARTTSSWVVKSLVDRCLRNYVIMEAVGERKMEPRFHLAHTINTLWRMPEFRTRIVERVHSADFEFEQFVHYIVTDATYMLDHALEGLKELGKEYRRNPSVNPDAHAGSITGFIEFSQQMLEIMSNMCVHSADALLVGTLPPQVAVMLDYFITNIAGPESMAISLPEHMCKRLSFDSRALVEQLVGCYVGIARSTKRSIFADAMARDARSYRPQVFFDLVEFLQSRRIGGEGVEFVAAMFREASAKHEALQQIEAILDDPPEEMTCALTYVLMEDPMKLPGVADVFVEGSSILHSLLDNPQNPYNREPLTREELLAYNEQEDVKKERTALKKSIQAWKSERLAAAAAAAKK